jgi:hypothetical protein
VNPPGERVLSSRYLPFLFGALTSLLVAWTWSGNHFSPRISDERAYLFQAEIFAHGHWKLPPRPIPEFFEQEHVFVTPFVASKYPPGHSLILVPGIWVHWPAIMPVLLAGAAGALIFFLAQAVGGNGAGFITWAIWTSMSPTIGALADYFSETTTLVCWLLGWFAMLRRHRGGGARWVQVAMGSAAWMMITRPLTGIAYAIPAGIVILYIEWQKKSLRPLLYGAAVVAAIGAMVPLWSWRTTGDALTTPYVLYTRTYIPFDKPGFGIDSTPPLRASPSDLAADYEPFLKLHREHTTDRLPSIAMQRISELLKGLWPSQPLMMAGLLLIGIFAIPAAALPAVAAALLLVAFYLAYAHPAHWLLYYVETLPVFAFVAATGLRRIVSMAERLWKNPKTTRWILNAVGALAFVACIRGVSTFRKRNMKPVRLRELIAAIPTPRNLVFVHYPEQSGSAFLLVANGPFLEKEKNIIVFDRGAVENARLAALYPERRQYMMNVESWSKATITTLK